MGDLGVEGWQVVVTFLLNKCIIPWEPTVPSFLGVITYMFSFLGVIAFIYFEVVLVIFF